jgi:hypothetical protein
MNSLVGDLEIVARHVWGAVGGPEGMPPAGGGNNPLAQEVHFEHVDPKKFGIEVAGCEPVEFVAGEEGTTKDVLLGTLRPFKPMDMIVSTYVLQTGEAPSLTLAVGSIEISSCNIGGTNQFTSDNPIPADIFASLFSAPRPRIQFGTVQTSPKLTLKVKCTLTAGVIPVASLGGKLKVYVTFGGVAAKM